MIVATVLVTLIILTAICTGTWKLMDAYDRHLDNKSTKDTEV